MSWDNTAPLAIPAAAGQNNAAPTALGAAAAPSNVAPGVFAAAGGHNNGAPSAIAAAGVQTGAVPGSFAASTGAAVAFVGDLTNASAIIATTAPYVALLAVGMGVRGAGVPAGATIAALGATTVTLSKNATATAAGVALNAYRPPVILAADPAMNNAVPVAVAAAPGHNNSAPGAFDPAAAMSALAPTAIGAAAAHNNAAPGAIAAAPGAGNAEPGAVPPAAASTDTPPFPIGSNPSALSLPVMPSAFTPAFVQLTGGGNSLSTLTASVADAAAGRIVQGVVNGELKSYQVRAGTDAQALPGIVRPANFNDPANAVVFVQL